MSTSTKFTGWYLRASEQLREQPSNGVRFDASGLLATV